eukprot:CAMPEP_0115602106 /NCGR_PEP_ID=MMETSP0272-20121206/15744_1 /TAXON_ID=71861 /ORGANISM="Scrippsiella trochoidea, Strain CCMP3099" /LENGTH=39 /DNA_ID= /DNA_START= /DNA_END= /DNA_ORIENTATION=
MTPALKLGAEDGSQIGILGDRAFKYTEIGRSRRGTAATT